MADPHPTQYDSFADEYENHAASAPYNALYDRPATLDLLGEVDGLRILDAGCGPGFYLEILRERGAEVAGYDASPRMVELARARVGYGVDIRVHDLSEPLDWVPDGTIDVVLSALAYHYVNDRPAFLAEAARVLARDGSLVISTHHPTGDWEHLGGSYFEDGQVTETWSKGWEVTTQRVPLTTLTAEFHAAGFVIEQLVEPRPLAAMASSHPEDYARLSTVPAFILFRLRKDPRRALG